MNILGWAGTFFLSIASIPQLCKVVLDGNARGMAWGYVLCLLAGFGSMAVFSFKKKAAIQLRVSYSLQFLVFSVIVFYKLLGG